MFQVRAIERLRVLVGAEVTPGETRTMPLSPALVSKTVRALPSRSDALCALALEMRDVHDPIL